MPVGQMQLSPLAAPTYNSPIGTALHSMVAAYYAPQKARADIALKQAQGQQAQATANFLPYNNLITALKEPMVMALMQKNPGMRDQLLEKLSQMPMNFGTQPNQQGGGIVSGIQKAFGLNNNSGNDASSSNSSAPINQNSDNSSGQPPMNNSSQAPAGNSTQSNGAPQIGNIDPTTPTANKYGIDTGSPEGNRMLSQSSPSDSYTLQQQNQAHQQNVNYSNQNTSLQNDLDSAKSEGKDTQLLHTYTAEAKKYYDNAWTSGRIQNIPGIDSLSGFDQDLQGAKVATNGLVTTMASQLYGNHQSDYRDKLVANSKLDPSLGSKTFHQQADLIDAIGTRRGERLNFYNQAMSMGIKDPNKLGELWYGYQRQKPFYDVKSNSIIKRNEGSFPSYLKKVINNGQIDQDEINKASPVDNIKPQHVTEENIQETMRATGLSRNEVMLRLKKKGLV